MTTDLDRYLDHVYGDARFSYTLCTLDRANDGKWDEGKLVPYDPGNHAELARKIELAGEDGRDCYLVLTSTWTPLAPPPNRTPPRSPACGSSATRPRSRPTCRRRP